MKQISFRECLGPKRKKKKIPVPEDTKILACCKAGNVPRKQTAVSCEFSSESSTEVHRETTVACGLVSPVFTVQGVCCPHLLSPHGLQEWGKVQHSSPHFPLGKLICADRGLCRGGAGPPLVLPWSSLIIHWIQHFPIQLLLCLLLCLGWGFYSFPSWRRDITMQAQISLELTILLPRLPVLPPDHRPASSVPSENIMVVFETRLTLNSLSSSSGLELLISLLGLGRCPNV